MTSPHRSLRKITVSLAAAALTVGLVGCGDTDSGRATEDVSQAVSGDDSSATDDASAGTEESPSDGASDGASETESTDPGAETTPGSSDVPAETTAVPVYFVGQGPKGAAGSRGPVLFREFHQVDVAEPATEAAALLAAGDALDPDYYSLFPEGSLGEVSQKDGKIRVELPDDTYVAQPNTMNKRQAKIAAQSLVYTVQGALGSKDPVVVTRDGEPTTLFGIDSAKGIKAANQLDVLNLVNITSPAEGQTVSDSFTATGVGSSFESTFAYKVLDANNKAVVDYSTTGEGWMDRLYPWKAEVDVSKLAPGTYTFVVMTDDPTGGAEGYGASQDTRTIVIE